MRILQAILLLVGTPLLLATLTGFAAATFGAVTLFRPDPDTHRTGAWGSYFGVMLFLILGGILGGIGGFVTAITVITQGNDKRWPLPTWIGIAAGFLACAIGQFIARNTETSGLWKDVFVDEWWGVPLSFAILGALGGYLGTLTAQLRPNAVRARQTSQQKW
jgi:H+/Cl- antiporter ClcA